MSAAVHEHRFCVVLSWMTYICSCLGKHACTLLAMARAYIVCAMLTAWHALLVRCSDAFDGKLHIFDLPMHFAPLAVATEGLKDNTCQQKARGSSGSSLLQEALALSLRGTEVI